MGYKVDEETVEKLLGENTSITEIVRKNSLELESNRCSDMEESLTPRRSASEPLQNVMSTFVNFKL